MNSSLSAEMIKSRHQTGLDLESTVSVLVLRPNVSAHSQCRNTGLNFASGFQNSIGRSRRQNIGHGLGLGFRLEGPVSGTSLVVSWTARCRSLLFRKSVVERNSVSRHIASSFVQNR